MILPINALKAKYQEISNLFITEVNKTTVRIYYAPQTTLTNVSSNFDEVPKIIDSYGGREPIENLPDRQNESGTNLRVDPYYEDILCRVYWEPKIYDRDGNLIQDSDTCKIITYDSYSQQLVNAIYVLVNDRKCEILRSPVPYGMFGEKTYALSYWQIA